MKFNRPIMTSAELAQHKVTGYGRNYNESDDGYSDMKAEEKRGWQTLASWGKDGWNLGSWPYVMIYVRTHAGKFQLMQIVEGDRTAYEFASEDDRSAAIDYLFLWYAADLRWSPITWEQRSELDAGRLTVEDKYRGPYREE